MSSLLPRLPILLLCAALPLTGCVSKTRYDQQVSSAEQLRLQLDRCEEDRSQIKTSLADAQASLEQALVEQQAERERLSGIYHARVETLQQEISAQQQKQRQLEEQRQHLQQLSAELQRNLERERIAREARLAQMSSTYNELVGTLEKELERGELTIRQLKGQLTVNLVEKVLFASGTAELTEEGYRVLRQVGGALKKVAGKRIRVEGHTDNRPIKASLQQRFPSNWELAAARASHVVRFLQQQSGIGGEKLEIAAFGPYRPVADNDTAEGRAQNRRIEIVLVGDDDTSAGTADGPATD